MLLDLWQQDRRMWWERRVCFRDTPQNPTLTPQYSDLEFDSANPNPEIERLKDNNAQSEFNGQALINAMSNYGQKSVDWNTLKSALGISSIPKGSDEWRNTRITHYSVLSNDDLAKAVEIAIDKAKEKGVVTDVAVAKRKAVASKIEATEVTEFSKVYSFDGEQLINLEKDQQFEQWLEEIRWTNPGEGITDENIDRNKEVVREIYNAIKKLSVSPDQLHHKEFLLNGIQIWAAQALKESSLDPNSEAKGNEESYGIFQINNNEENRQIAIELGIDFDQESLSDVSNNTLIAMTRYLRRLESGQYITYEQLIQSHNPGSKNYVNDVSREFRMMNRGASPNVNTPGNTPESAENPKPKARVRWTDLPYRRSNNFSDQVIGRLSQGDEIALTGRREGMWLEADHPNGNGEIWVWGGKLKNPRDGKRGDSLSLPNSPAVQSVDIDDNSEVARFTIGRAGKFEFGDADFQFNPREFLDQNNQQEIRKIIEDYSQNINDPYSSINGLDPNVQKIAASVLYFFNQVLKKPLKYSSGFRDVNYNRQVNGANYSLHQLGFKLDFVPAHLFDAVKAFINRYFPGSLVHSLRHDAGSGDHCDFGFFYRSTGKIPLEERIEIYRRFQQIDEHAREHNASGSDGREKRVDAIATFDRLFSSEEREKVAKILDQDDSTETVVINDADLDRSHEALAGTEVIPITQAEAIRMAKMIDSGTIDYNIFPIRTPDGKFIVHEVQGCKQPNPKFIKRALIRNGLDPGMFDHNPLAAFKPQGLATLSSTGTGTFEPDLHTLINVGGNFSTLVAPTGHVFASDSPVNYGAVGSEPNAGGPTNMLVNLGAAVEFTAGSIYETDNSGNIVTYTVEDPDDSSRTIKKPVIIGTRELTAAQKSVMHDLIATFQQNGIPQDRIFSSIDFSIDPNTGAIRRGAHVDDPLSTLTEHSTVATYQDISELPTRAERVATVQAIKKVAKYVYTEGITLDEAIDNHNQEYLAEYNKYYQVLVARFNETVEQDQETS